MNCVEKLHFIKVYTEGKFDLSHLVATLQEAWKTAFTPFPAINTIIYPISCDKYDNLPHFLR